MIKLANEDKIIHAFIGAVAAMAPRSLGHQYAQYGIPLAFVVLVAIEVRQIFQADRSPDWEDVLFGMVGALMVAEAMR